MPKKHTDIKPRKNKQTHKHLRQTTLFHLLRPKNQIMDSLDQLSQEHTALRVPTSNTNQATTTTEARDQQTTYSSHKHDTLIQTNIINPTISNFIYGDDIMPTDQNELIYFHNINGIKSDDNWAQILQTLHEHQVTCFGLAEINTSFAHPMTKGYTKKLQQLFKHSRHSTSERISNITTHYKPGGTLTAVVGKWQARITERGEDSSGLGRWSYLRISSKKKNLIVMTAYRPTQAKGINTNWMQQWLLLRRKGVTNPEPIKEFYKDILSTLKHWREQAYEIILMIDANEVIGAKTGGLTEIATQINMADLVALHHGSKNEPNTHVRGSKRIDYILGTQRVQDCCTQSGILPFYNGYASDHRPIFARVDLSKLLSDTVTNLESQAARLLSKATPRERQSVIHLVNEHYESQNLYSRLAHLQEVPDNVWSDEHQAQYNECDRQHIIGLLSAEQKACRQKQFPWSPTYREAANRKTIWKILLSRARTNMPLTETTRQWIQQTIQRDWSTLPTLSECKAELRKAQKSLKSVKQQAHELRIEFLLQALDDATALSETTREAALQKIIQSQEKLQSFARIRQIFKPTQQGGIDHILVPSKESAVQWETITQPDQIQELLQQRNIQHFGMAHGTPFTQTPLTKLNWSADSEEAEKLIKGETVQLFTLESKKHLQDLVNFIRDMPQLPEINCQLTSKEVAQGF